MKLSVIIVSYNVRNFLESCLYSVEKAATDIDMEVIVVDNNSSDSSVEMVAEKFPGFKLMRNKENRGFSRANNQARELATGEYILFLNPDTLVEENTFRVCIDFMDSHPGAGAMGVKMTDAEGKFLPESKRSIPTPMVAFYKISGLTALFPRSKSIGRYYLGHLDKNMPHQIEVLTGAFFFARKKVLDETGWFDEAFFMYGEDIDLSCRIIQKKYTIHYHPGTSIIHYKGESTRKSSINYVLVFYKAMAIYARKHFNSPGTFLLIYLLFIAIYFRAFLSIAKRIISRLLLPVSDAAIIYLGFLIIPSTWEQQISATGSGYPPENQAVIIPALITLLIVSVFISGGYNKPFRIEKTLRGLFYGGITILIIYGMLSDQWYLKLITIIPIAIWAGIGTTIVRIFLASVADRPGSAGSVSNTGHPG